MPAAGTSPSSTTRARNYAHGGYRTQRKAKAAYEALLNGPYTAPTKGTVSEYLALWLETRQAADISPGTRALDKGIVSAYIVPHVGSVPLQKLGTTHV